MKKKELTINEIFCGMPHLKMYFQQQERTIKKIGEGNVDNPAIKKLEKEKNALLKIAKGMCIEDLRVVQYVHTIKNLRPYRVVEILRNTSVAVQELERLPKDIEKP